MKDGHSGETDSKKGHDGSEGRTDSETEDEMIREVAKKATREVMENLRNVSVVESNSTTSIPMDGTKTIEFLFSFGASCLEK